jgi:glycosyltransferase involved in cell wall biosynthesis
MNILYLSCHSILEYDEVKLFTEMGHKVLADGAYIDPTGHITLPRPGISNAARWGDLERLAREYPKTNLPPELIEPFDIIFAVHTPEFITENWDKIKHKKVIWRSIGQSTRQVENAIRRMRYEGLKIVRYSPRESRIPDYLGADAIIRFYKDEKEFGTPVYNGDTKRVVNFSQSLKGRGIFCHYDHIMRIIDGFPSIIYGSGNEDLGPLNGGEIPYDLFKGAMRDNRVMVYGGTWPASYTLSFIEGLMSGIPIVAVGADLAQKLPDGVEFMEFYEIPDIIKNGENGFVSDNIDELRQDVHAMLEDQVLAKQIGENGRKTAIELFGKENIQKQWEEFFKNV